MNYEEKQKDLEMKFEQIKQEIQILNNNLIFKQEELLRLQGEFRLLQELRKNYKNEIKSK